MAVDADPDHPILDSPWTWDLLEFNYRYNPSDWRESYIDMVFCRDEVIRRLRFFGPQDLEVQRGVLNTSGLCILDVSGRQLEGVRVRVECYEGSSSGVPRFWASRVVDLDTEK